MNKADKNKYYKQKYQKGYTLQTPPKPKTFEFSVLPLRESFVIFWCLLFCLFSPLFIFQIGQDSLSVYIFLCCAFVLWDIVV